MPQTGISILSHPELASSLSKQDVAALSALSDASQVRAWTKRKVAKYKKYISALLAIHNSIAPINKLPTEILQEVFAYVPCSANWLHSVLDLYRVMLDESDDAIDEDEDSRCRYLVDLFLDRSAPLPLEVKIWQAPYERSIGWEAFAGHFDRFTAFEVEVKDKDDLYNVLDTVTTSKRLERFELSIPYGSEIYGEEFTFDQWEAEDLPCLGRLQVAGNIFCRATTVPSLRTVTLFSPQRTIVSLPGLLDALEGCPALASIYLVFDAPPAHTTNADYTLNRIVNLPNLQLLQFGGSIPDISCFLSCLSFPSTTLIDMFVNGDVGYEFALLSILPRRISGLHTSPTIDRLYIHFDDWPRRAGFAQPHASIVGFVQGTKRLMSTQVCRLRSAADCLRFLEAFAACTVTELALDVGPLPSDMAGDFWTHFFAALPDVRRLELLSRTTQSRETKRDIAEHFLASARSLQQAGHRTSLGWLLRAKKGSTAHLEKELGDIEQILRCHADQGGTLDRLELYIMIPPLGIRWWSDMHDITQIATDSDASRFVTRDYVSRLASAAKTVVVGGGWGFAEDDELNAEESKDRNMGRNEHKEEEAGSHDMQVT